MRTAPALGEKKKAAVADEAEGPEAKRKRVNAPERPSPFRPPYVPGLYVGGVAGVDGEPDLSVLVRAAVSARLGRKHLAR